KYFVGARVRLDDQTIRTKEENGTVTTIKRKKLSQKPSGLIGLLDAYILTQLKPITDFVTPAATFYVLIVNPYLLANKEMKNYKGDDKGKDAPKPVTIEEVKQVLQMLQQVVPSDAKSDVKVV
ncbi:MAG TPA: hypothetical protein VKU36_06060, partial [Candidatus Babeliales bacterium]|nr:hypothetical protein [Candidatus Babeliales bacterium]